MPNEDVASDTQTAEIAPSSSHAYTEATVAINTETTITRVSPTERLTAALAVAYAERTATAEPTAAPATNPVAKPEQAVASAVRRCTTAAFPPKTSTTHRNTINFISRVR